MKIGDKYIIKPNRETEFGKYADIITREGKEVTIKEIRTDGTYIVESANRLHVVRGENLEGVTVAKTCKCGKVYLTTGLHTCDTCTECFMEE